MRFTKDTELLLLGIWLIAVGILSLAAVGSVFLIIVDILAIVVGIVILVRLGSTRKPEKAGMLLLAIWLIVQAALSLLGVGSSVIGVILAVLAIIAGVLILIGFRGRKPSENIGRLLLALWLIIGSLLPLLGVGFSGMGAVLAIMAIVAGVLLIISM